VRSSSNSDGMPDAGAGLDAGPLGSSTGTRAPMQRREVQSQDGGPSIVYVGDRAGKLTEIKAAIDGGLSAPGAGPLLTDLQQQIVALQARQTEMQQRQNSTQEQVQLLQQMNDQLRSLNGQMTQAQTDRAAQAAQAADQQQQTQAAINGLAPALQMLQSGNGQIGDALDAAQQAFPPQAQRDLAAARDAITNSNLNLARGYIQTAIGDAQAGR